MSYTYTSHFAKDLVIYTEYLYKQKKNIRSTTNLLKAFDRYCVEINFHGKLTQDLVIEYSQRGSVSLMTQGGRYRAIRDFYRFCAILDDSLPKIMDMPIAGKKLRHNAYIYTDAEILKLMTSPAQTMPWDKALLVRWQCLLGLMACTGIRIGEALNLNIDDIDWKEKTLFIQNSKFGKSRIIPVHSSLLKAFSIYLQYRISPADPECKALFISRKGGRCHCSTIEMLFRKIATKAKVGEGKQPIPRIHDLRHTFAIRTILNWYKQGVDVNNEILTLSTYLGHARYEDTIYYLESSSEILHEMANKFHFPGGQYEN